MLDECVLEFSSMTVKTSLNVDGWVSGVCRRRENNRGGPECPSL